MHDLSIRNGEMNLFGQNEVSKSDIGTLRQYFVLLNPTRIGLQVNPHPATSASSLLEIGLMDVQSGEDNPGRRVGYSENSLYTEV